MVSPTKGRERANYEHRQIKTNLRRKERDVDLNPTVITLSYYIKCKWSKQVNHKVETIRLNKKERKSIYRLEETNIKYELKAKLSWVIRTAFTVSVVHYLFYVCPSHLPW